MKEQSPLADFARRRWSPLGDSFLTAACASSRSVLVSSGISEKFPMKLKNPAIPPRSMRSKTRESMAFRVFRHAEDRKHMFKSYGLKRRVQPYWEMSGLIRNRTCLPALCSASLRHHKSVLSHNRSAGSAMSDSCPRSTHLHPLQQSRKLCELPLSCCRRCADT